MSRPRVYLDDASKGDTGGTSFTFDGLTCGRDYGIAVDAVDAAGNRSPKATIRAATSACPFSARVAKVRVLRSGKTRTVAVTLNASAKTRARLALKRAGRTVATVRATLWQERVHKVNWELFDRGTEAYTWLALEELAKGAANAGLLGGASHGTECERFAEGCRCRSPDE